MTTLDAFARNYVQETFGWSPLVADAVRAAAALCQIDETRIWRNELSRPVVMARRFAAAMAYRSSDGSMNFIAKQLRISKSAVHKAVAIAEDEMEKREDVKAVFQSFNREHAVN